MEAYCVNCQTKCEIRNPAPVTSPWQLSVGSMKAASPAPASGPFARVLARSGMDAYDLVPVGRLLVGVSGPHEKRVLEEAPDELHADPETS